MPYPFYGYNPYPMQDNLQQLRNQAINQQMYQQPQPAQQQNQDERIWVQGESSAQAYLVAPNSFVRLWDSLAPVFYEKRADQSGRPYMETYEYKIKGSQNPNPATINTVDYESKIKSLEERISALESRKERYAKSDTNDSAVSAVSE